MSRSLLPALPFLLLAAPALAQQAPHPDGWSISGSVRARGEAIDDNFRSNATPDSDAALLLRSRIKVQYDDRAFFVGGELVDSRAYFERTRSSIGANDVDTVEPVQAYVGVRLNPATTVTLGRFTLPLGSGRLVADPAFRNTPNGFTGARLDWFGPDPGDALTAFWTMPQQHRPTDRDDIRDNHVQLDKERGAQQFFGAIATKVLGGQKLELYGYRLVEHDRPDDDFATRNRHIWTYGARLVRAPAKGRVDYEVEAARQTGRTRLSASAADRMSHEVDAGFVHAEVGRTLAAAWSPRLALRFDYGSGDGPGGSYGRFDGLYGSRVLDFGPSSLFGLESAGNIVSAEGRIEVKPDARNNGFLAVRPVWTARSGDLIENSGLRDTAGRFGRYVGLQFDGRVRHVLVPKTLQLELGGALLFKGRLLKDEAASPDNGPTTKYGYAALEFTF